MWLLHLGTEALTFIIFMRVTEELTCCFVVVVARLKKCRVPSSGYKEQIILCVFFNCLSALKELSYCFLILFITTVQLTYKRKFTFLFSSYTVLPVVNPIQRSALLENLGTTGPLARNSRILILHLTIKTTCHEIFHL